MTNSRKTKRALLSSVTTLLLCFAMLIGSTFAWFTDTATTSVNKIQAGTLDVQLLDAQGSSLEGSTLEFKKADSAPENESVLWEPGCTYNLQPITIKNNGDLALKYKVIITGIQGSAKLNEAIEWTITLNGANNTPYTTALTADHELAAKASNTLTISGHMKDSAGNEYMGQSIDGIAITVYATQLNAEYDSNGNTYDQNADYLIPWDGTTETAPTQTNGVYHITSAAEFVSFITTIKSGSTATYTNKTVSLDCDIDLGGRTITTTAEQGNRTADGLKFEGNGHTVSNFTLDSTANTTGYYGGLFGYLAGWNAASIKDLTVRNATVIGGKQTGVIVGGINNINSTVENCKVYDCTVIGTKKVGAVVGYTANGIVKDCYAENCTVYCQENDADECGEVIGFINTVDSGCIDRTENNTANNVTVNYGVNVEIVDPGVLKENNTYLISSAEGLKYCATNFTRSNTTINKVFKLTADVDMTGITWEPWCNEDQYFVGLFDGQNHTIKNLTINDTHTAYDGHAVGFIGRLGENANGEKILKNVTFDNANVSGHHYVGVAVGYNEFGKVDNVKVTNSKVTATHVEGADSCGDKAGALIGMCGPNAGYISVTNCSASNCEVKAARDAAQLIGYGYTSNNDNPYSDLSATNVTVTAVVGSCEHERAGIVSANALVGNGTATGLTLS